MTTARLPARRRPLPFFIVPVAVALMMMFGIGPNYLLALLACVVLVIGVFLLWRPGEAQILLFLFTLQWLQIAVCIFHANAKNRALSEIYYRYPGIDYAITLVGIGLVFLVLGMRFGAGPQQHTYLMETRNAIGRLSSTRWLHLHAAFWGVSTAALAVATVIPGLSQPLLALGNMKWATFVIFTVVTFSRPDGPRAIWAGLFLVELVMSLGGYFSSFKFVFLYTLIALSAVGQRVSPTQAMLGTILATVMLVFGLYWTAIKIEYRNFVSGGEAAQIVTVGKFEAVQKIVELSGGIKPERLVQAFDELADRFAEVDIFSAVVMYVPVMVPHTGGAIWFDAISRPLMPRILFPDKAAIDESELAREYTGMAVAGSESGTQISMGYFADSYIDFGEFGMMGAVFLFGYFLGYLYRWFMLHPNGFGLLGSGLAAATLIQASSIGNSSAKLVGSIVVCVLVAMIILNIVVPRYMPWLRPCGR